MGQDKTTTMQPVEAFVDNISVNGESSDYSNAEQDSTRTVPEKYNTKILKFLKGEKRVFFIQRKQRLVLVFTCGLMCLYLIMITKNVTLINKA